MVIKIEAFSVETSLSGEKTYVCYLGSNPIPTVKSTFLTIDKINCGTLVIHPEVQDVHTIHILGKVVDKLKPSQIKFTKEGVTLTLDDSLWLYLTEPKYLGSTIVKSSAVWITPRPCRKLNTA